LGGVIRSSNLSLGKSSKMKVLKLIWNLSDGIGLGDTIPTPRTALKSDAVCRRYSASKFCQFQLKKAKFDFVENFIKKRIFHRIFWEYSVEYSTEYSGEYSLAANEKAPRG